MTAASRPPRITEDDMNSYFVHDDGSVWRVVTYAAQPTATLECLYGRASCSEHYHHRIGGVVGAPIFAGLRKLVPEERP